MESTYLFARPIMGKGYNNKLKSFQKWVQNDFIWRLLGYTGTSANFGCPRSKLKFSKLAFFDSLQVYTTTLFWINSEWSEPKLGTFTVLFQTLSCLETIDGVSHESTGETNARKNLLIEGNTSSSAYASCYLVQRWTQQELCTSSYIRSSQLIWRLNKKRKCLTFNQGVFRTICSILLIK